MPSVVTSGSRTASRASRSSRRFLKSVRTVYASCCNATGCELSLANLARRSNGSVRRAQGA